MFNKNKKLVDRLCNRWGWCDPEQVRKGFKRDVRRFMGIIGDMDKVTVSKTSDTDDYVISIKDSRGRCTSIWMRGDYVRSVSPY
jgi:hypothetical protein